MKHLTLVFCERKRQNALKYGENVIFLKNRKEFPPKT